MAQCPFCGAPTEEGVSFCLSCGMDLSGVDLDAAAPVMDAAQEYVPTYEPTPAPESAPSFAPAPTSAPATDPTPAAGYAPDAATAPTEATAPMPEPMPAPQPGPSPQPAAAPSPRPEPTSAPAPQPQPTDAPAPQPIAAPASAAQPQPAAATPRPTAAPAPSPQPQPTPAPAAQPAPATSGVNWGVVSAALGVAIVILLFALASRGGGSSAPATPTSQTTAQENNARAATAQFPSEWQGYFGGKVGDSMEEVPFYVSLAASEDGSLSGVCQVDTYGSYYVSGSIDWSSGYVWFDWDGWIDKGTLTVKRGFTGYLDTAGMDWMSGDCAGADGRHASTWELFAV